MLKQIKYLLKTNKRFYRGSRFKKIIIKNQEMEQKYLDQSIPQNNQFQHSDEHHHNETNNNLKKIYSNFEHETENYTIKNEDKMYNNNARNNKSKSFKSSNRLNKQPVSHIGEHFPSDNMSDFLKLKKFQNQIERNQSKHAYRPRIDPKNTTIMLFPGQGSQFVGMGKKLLEYPNVSLIYKTANKILGYDLLELCLSGPKEKLDKTVHCQPAIFVASLAAVEKLKHSTPSAIENCVSTAGFSVGEYAALVFAGSLTFENGLRLVKARAQAMQVASEKFASAMVSVLISPESNVNFACQTARLYCSKELGMEDPVCQVANYLYPGCKVIAGNIQALKFIERNASEFGLRRIKYLPVSGAFHTGLMKGASEHFSKIIESVPFEESIIPVYSNVTSHRYFGTNYKKLLVQQISKPVLWEQTLHVLYSRPQGEDFPTTYEVGPGKQMGSVLKKVNSKAYEQYKNIDV